MSLTSYRAAPPRARLCPDFVFRWCGDPGLLSGLSAGARVRVSLAFGLGYEEREGSGLLPDGDGPGTARGAVALAGAGRCPARALRKAQAADLVWR